MMADPESLDAIRGDFARYYEAAITEFFAGDASIAQAARYAALPPGKLLRPLLAIAAGDACRAPRGDSYRVGAAAEMMHAASLVHDDLPAVDNDTLRRGRATCHVKFGAATAMYAGLALQAKALALLADAGGPRGAAPEVRLFWVKAFADAMGAPGIAGGQVLDLEFERQAVAVEALLTMYGMKSSALFEATLTAAALPGVVTAPHAETVLGLFRQLARELGEGFQMIDDLLDAAGDEPAFGKTPGKDLASGKATPVSIWGHERAHREVAARHDRCRRRLDEIERLVATPAGLLRGVIERIFARLPEHTH